MKKYTVDIHVRRLKEMLEKHNPCLCCPAQRNFRTHTIFMYHNPCNICRKFVDTEDVCPCSALGKEKVIKRTWIAIEEYEDKVKLQQRKTTT
jgi:hypothetical protein